MNKLLLICCGLLPVSGLVFAQDRPNIIWLMAEDIGPDLECYGMEAVKTPHLNQLANEGIKFEHCFVTNPICSPSRSAMMVGTHQNKINAHHHRSNRKIPLHQDYQPFTFHLRKAGYTTILGHHGVMQKGRKIDVNFKHQAIGEWDGKTQFGLFDKYDTFEKADEPFFAQIQLKVTHRGDWWNDIRSKSKHPVDPAQVVLPPYMADHPIVRLDWARYLDQIEYMDEEVGMILQELEDKDLADNTIIIFIGDNGRCNIRGKGYLHAPGVHIPLIVHYPEKYRTGQVRKDVVAATDITASILDAAGLNIPKYMTGRPIFEKKSKRKYAFAARDLWDEIEEQSRAITSHKWKYIRNDKPEVPFDAGQAYLEFYRPAVHVMRSLREKGDLNSTEQLFFQPTKPREELYNLRNDPDEINNLADQVHYRQRLQKMRKYLSAYEVQMAPISEDFQAVHPAAVELLDWVKHAKPDLYRQMQEGVEIGFQRLRQEYKAENKK